MSRPNLTIVPTSEPQQICNGFNTKMRIIEGRVQNMGDGGTLNVVDVVFDGTADIPDAELSSNVALLDRASQTFTGNVGIGGAPTNRLDVFQNQNAASIIQITNSNAGTASQAIVAAVSDSAALSIRVHSTGRVATRYGITLGGYAELLTTGGNGLLIGNGTINGPIVLGTNGVEVMRLDGNKITALQGPLRLKNYTVGTLPAGTQGDTAYVTDATAPVFGAAVVGGGAVVIPVFYNGAAWIVG